MTVADSARQADPGQCDDRSFWISGFAERRVLVEAWVYTDRGNTEAQLYGPPAVARVPYWRPGLLAANDAAFRSPSALTLGLLRDRYHVRWLVTLRRLPDPASLRFRAGRCAVYELTPAPGPSGVRPR